MERGEFEDSSAAASDAVDAVTAMHEACTLTCKLGCGGCRVARLVNLTSALREGVEQAAEFGYFVDDERTTSVLPAKLNSQASNIHEIPIRLPSESSVAVYRHSSRRTFQSSAHQPAPALPPASAPRSLPVLLPQADRPLAPVRAARAQGDAAG